VHSLCGMYEPIRGGTRGGQAEFKWTDVSADKDREHYLGHSINAPTGRWQKNKDIHWYNRDGKQTESERQAEIRRIKEAEEEAISIALGFAPAKKGVDVSVGEGEVSGNQLSPSPADEAKQKEKEERKLRKLEKKARKAEKKTRKEEKRSRRREDSDSEHDHHSRGENQRGRSRSRSPHLRRRSVDEGSFIAGRRSASPRRDRHRSRTPPHNSYANRETERWDRRGWDEGARRDDTSAFRQR